MEVDEIQSPKQLATKYSRISSNGGGVVGDGANAVESTTVMNGVGGGGRWGRQWGDSSRIIRVSRASGGKDRHSKVWTAKGPRDRRVRLSVTTAIPFYDLQDRLGFDQPSKAVQWLINQASDAINDLPSLDVANFPPELGMDGVTNGLGSLSKSGCSSSSNNSETSKGSGLSLLRSESRVKARKKARERTAKENEQQGITESWPQQQPQPQPQQQQQQQQNASFTQLLTAGINTHDTAVVSSTASRGMSAEYFGNGLMGLSASRPFNGDHEIQHQHNQSHNHNHNHNHNQQHFPFLIDQHEHEHEHHRLGQTATITAASGFNRGTLQSNSSSSSSMLSYLQRFSDGSSVPFFLGGAPISPIVDNQHHHHQDNHQQFNSVGLHLCYGDHKGKGKN